MDDMHSERDENQLGQYIPLHYHYTMLQDKDRVGAFREAIEAVVRPGMKVLELGGGTGILSYFAARQGATVWCVERIPQLAERAGVFLRNNLSGDEKVNVVVADAATYLPPVPVDVVICEMLHVAMLREKQLHVLRSFKQAYTSQFGDQLPRFIPEHSLLAFQPVEQSFDFGGYHAPVPQFQSAAPANPRTRPLAELVPYSQFFYDEALPLEFAWKGETTVEASGVVNALRFVTQNNVTILQQEGRAISWANQFLVLPLAKPVTVAEGQSVQSRFKYEAGAAIESLSSSIQVQALSLRRTA